MAAVRPFTKYAGRATCARDLAPALTAAVKATVTGRPGAAYVDLPSDVLMAAVPPGEVPAARAEDPGDAPAGFPAVAERQHADAEAVAAAAALLRGAQRSASPRVAQDDQNMRVQYLRKVIACNTASTCTPQEKPFPKAEKLS